MSAEVEIPAFYVDAVLLDDLGVGAVPWLTVYSRNPAPVETGARVDLGFDFTIACNSTDSLLNLKTWVKIGDVAELLVLDASIPFTAPGWNVNFSGPTDTATATFLPDVDFPPLTKITVRIEATTSGGQFLGTSWSFETEDLVAPEVSGAVARDSMTVRVTFNEPVGDTALDPENYTFERLNVFPQAAVNVVAVGVTRISSTIVDVALDIEMSQGVLYRVTVEGVEDLFGNVIEAPDNTATFSGVLCVNAPADRRFDLFRMIPQKNREEDITQELEAFFNCLQDVTNLLLCSIDEWTDILDPDKAPEAFVDAMLDDLGNPFAFDLTLQEKRRLLSVLVAAYKQKGTAIGIVNLVRLFLGIEVGVIPFNGGGFGWELGEDELGDAELGSDIQANLYSFEIVATQDLTEEQVEVIRTIAEYMKPAHTHLVAITEPAASLVIDHVELGLSELGDEFILH